MDKAESSREVPKWEKLDRNILALIFGKLPLKDLTMGASRVCNSWFLASHNNTLWKTVDLQPRESLSLINIMIKIIILFFDTSLRGILKNITKFSGTAPKNLFFNFYSYVKEEDLMFAAERMPHIEKLVLPVWCYQTENSFRFVFSQWRNLKTLILAHDLNLSRAFKFQAVGENCGNLTNLKYLGYLDETVAAQIVRHLPNLDRLSLRCSFVSTSGVLLLIRGLQNLVILNVSHCKDLVRYGYPVRNEDLIQAATRKLKKFIVCSPKDCKVCKSRRGTFWLSCSKHWRNDEIVELKF